MHETAPAEAPAHTTRLSWAEAAKKPPAEALPEPLQRRIEESKRAMLQPGIGPADRGTTGARPQPKALYFGRVPRGTIGTLRRALHASVPKWAVLNLSFVGTSAPEILCHAPLSDRLTARMKLLGFCHVSNFNPLSTSTGPSKNEKAQLAACYRRWSPAAAQTSSAVSQAW